jgi:protein-S-isoprenylcysteine O-methyltransferase Ste14
MAAWLAATMGTADLFVAALAIGLTAFYVRAARAEEQRFLSSSFADAYRAYMARAGMLFPNGQRP